MTPSVCEVNGTTFNHSSSYSHHKNAHSSKEYSCSVCQKPLQVHKKSHDETSHHCDQCDQDFTNIGNLSRHANSAHKKLSFSCAVADCGKVFHRKDVMKKHFTKCKSRAKNYQKPQLKTPKIMTMNSPVLFATIPLNTKVQWQCTKGLTTFEIHSFMFTYLLLGTST